MIGHIKLDRKILNWEWYSDYKMVHLFIHLLLKANWQNNTWQGIPVERGQLLTCLTALSKNTGLTMAEVRRTLNSLQTTGEITIKTTNKYSIITICKYGVYQSEKNKNNTQNNTQADTHINTQTDNTIIKEEDKNKNYSEYVCYNVEEFVLGNDAVFEKILMSTGKETEYAKSELHKYHLWLEKNSKYPVGKKPVLAGYESWLLDETYKNNKNGSKSINGGNTGEKLGTSEARIKTARSW